MVALVSRALVWIIAVCLVACQPAAPTGPGSLAPGEASTKRASITVRINTDQGMATKARNRTVADIASYKIRLFTTGTDGYTASDAAAAYVATVPAGSYVNPYTINGISDGSYYLMVEAFDNTNMSITQSTSRFSINNVVLSGGTAFYLPSGANLIVNLKLIDGTAGLGQAMVSQTPPAFLAATISYGLALVNRLTGNVVSVQGFAPNMDVKNIQEGDFDIWAYTGNTSFAIPAKPKMLAIAVGSDGTTTPNFGAWGFTDAVFETPAPASTLPTAGPLAVTKDGSAYYISGNDIKKLGDAGFTITASAPPTALALAPDGTLYYTDGLTIKRADGTVMATSTAAPSAMAAAADGTVYYADGLNIKKAGQVAAVTPTVTACTAMALDRVGNVYFTDDGWIKMACTKTGTYVGTGAFVAGTTYSLNRILGAIYGGLAIDPACNIYATDFNHHRVVMMGAGGIYIYRITGTGTAGITVTAASASTATITLPKGIAVSDTGELYFTSSNGTDNVLRKVW